MKHLFQILYYTLFAFIVSLAISACGGSSGSEGTDQASEADNKASSNLVFTNPMSSARDDAPILISRSTLSSLAGEVPMDLVPKLTTSDGKNIPSQVDDLDGDGRWDELAAVYSFQANEKLQVAVEYVEPPTMPEYQVRTNIRLALNGEDLKEASRTAEDIEKDTRKPYQMEGPGWESDKVGFRLYFDNRNGKDIFGKRVSRMTLDSTGIDEDYHALQPWGMDVLKVGNSLGAGSLAIKDGDQMYRVGIGESSSFKIIAEGPVRSIMQMTYTNMKIDDETVTVRDRISIWAGKYWCQSEVTLSGFEGEKTLVTGIVNLHSEEKVENKPNPFYVTIGTHDAQSENSDMLGMGLILNSSDFIVAEQAPEEGEGITQTFYVELEAKNQQPVSYIFVAAWELSDEKFADPEQFYAYLDSEADKLNQPIGVAASENSM